MQILRSVAAIIAGYLVFALSAVLLFQLSGHDPHSLQGVPYMVFAIIYGMFFATLGGLLTARLAPGRPALHAMLLTAVIALGATVSLVASPRAGSTWSHWSAMLLMAPCAWLAPYLRGRRH